MIRHGSYERRWYRFLGWWELHVGHRGIPVDFTIPLPPKVRFRRTPAEDAERLDRGHFPHTTNDMQEWMRRDFR